MASGNEASWAIELPNQFDKFGNILQDGINAKGQQNQMMYNLQLQQRQKAEQDQWKKLNLIQDLTDLSKHQTGSDVANAIGNGQVSKLFQKYTQASGQMSPAQLQSEINRDMSSVVGAMDGVKQELDASDEELKLMKQAYPNLDYAKMAREKRADILHRRLKSDTEFLNPLEVQPSEVDFSNPGTLAKYVTTNKPLVDKIVEAKGAENESVLMGKQGDYTKFEGKLTQFKRPTYDRKTFNGEGFYTGKNIPSLEIKASDAPKEVLPYEGSNPYKVIDEDVYRSYVPNDSQEKAILVKEARTLFPDYDTFSQQKKEYAERHALYKLVEANDQSQLHPTGNVRPPITRINVNAGGSASKKGEENMLDVYNEVANKFDTIAKPSAGSLLLGTPSPKLLKLNSLSTIAQQSLLKQANTIAANTEDNLNDPDKSQYRPFKQDDIYIEKDDKDNQLYMVDTKSKKRIAPIDFGSTNIVIQPGINEKRAVIQADKKLKTGSSTPTSSKSNMVTVVLENGVSGEIPESQVAQFLKDHPKAKRK